MNCKVMHLFRLYPIHLYFFCFISFIPDTFLLLAIYPLGSAPPIQSGHPPDCDKSVNLWLLFPHLCESAAIFPFLSICESVATFFPVNLWLLFFL
jgi:hypothetical protein